MPWPSPFASSGNFLAPKMISTIARIATTSHPFNQANIGFISSKVLKRSIPEVTTPWATRKAPTEGSARSRRLLQNHEFRAAIAGVTFFGLVIRSRLVFAKARGRDALGRKPVLLQKIFAGGNGPAFTERTIVFFCAAFIAMTLDQKLHVRSVLEVSCHRIQFGLLALANRGTVEIKINSVRRERFAVLRAVRSRFRQFVANWPGVNIISAHTRSIRVDPTVTHQHLAWRNIRDVLWVALATCTQRGQEHT